MGPGLHVERNEGLVLAVPWMSFMIQNVSSGCLYTETPTGQGCLLALPFGIVEKDEHTGAFIILKALIVMAVGIANQVVKDGRVDDVQEAWARVVRGRFLHSITVTLIVLPPAGKHQHGVTAERQYSYLVPLNEKTRPLFSEFAPGQSVAPQGWHLA